MTKSLRKCDHVSSHHHNLNWLPVSHQIKLRSLCTMFRYYYQRGKCLQLDPPVQYGRQHSYQTRCRDSFASVILCHLASTKSNFRSAATTWWNSLPSHIYDSNLNLGNFTKAVRNFYMDHCFNESVYYFVTLLLAIVFCMFCCSS